MNREAVEGRSDKIHISAAVIPLSYSFGFPGLGAAVLGGAKYRRVLPIRHTTSHAVRQRTWQRKPIFRRRRLSQRERVVYRRGEAGIADGLTAV
jgi:hypothetical protein